MLKKLLLVSLVVLCTLSFSTFASAGLNEVSTYEVDDFFTYTLGWDAEEDSTWNFSGTFWNAEVTIADDGFGNWDVDWYFQHNTVLHSGEVIPPTYHGIESFANNLQFFTVISDDGAYNHPFSGHVEEWKFNFYRSNTDSAENTIEFVAAHVVPEPISSILFLTGGALIAGTSLVRRKKA